MPRKPKPPANDPAKDLGLDRDPCVQFFLKISSTGQRLIWDSTELYQCVTAANQSGKTTTLLVELAAYARGLHPTRPKTGPVNILLVAPARSQLSAIYHERLCNSCNFDKEGLLKFPELEGIDRLPLIPESEFALNKAGRPDISYAASPMGKSPGKYILKDGSKIYFHISGDPNSWKRVQGFAFDAVFRDEAVGNHNLTAEIRPRLITNQGKASKPHAGFYKWFATETEVNHEFIDFKRQCQTGIKDHVHAVLTSLDNPAVSVAARQRMADSMDPEDANIRIWATESASSRLNVLAPPFKRERHLYTEVYEPGPLDNLFVGYDPGWRHPFGLVFAAIGPDNPYQLRILDCETGTGKTLEHIVNCVSRFLNGRKLEAFVFDPDASKTERSSGQTLIEQLIELLKANKITPKRGFIKATNIYENTIPLFKRYLDPDPENKDAEPLLKINPPTHGKCGFLIDQIERYSYKPDADRSKRIKGDQINRKGDDLVDPTRYLISRQFVHVAREPNHATSAPIGLSATPIPRAAKPDPFKVTPDMNEDERRHLQMLRKSAENVSRIMAEQRGIDQLEEVHCQF